MIPKFISKVRLIFSGKSKTTNDLDSPENVEMSHLTGQAVSVTRPSPLKTQNISNGIF